MCIHRMVGCDTHTVLIIVMMQSQNEHSTLAMNQAVISILCSMLNCL